MRRLALATGWMVVAALAAGCGSVVGGTAKPAPNLKPRPLSGRTVEHVLLDVKAVSRMLGQPLVARQPAKFGGPDGLDQREAPAESAECLGVVAMLQKSVYDSADVQNVASVSWWNDGDPAQVISVMEGVVALPSVAQAQALFAKFPEQWQRCKGQTTTEDAGPISTTTYAGFHCHSIEYRDRNAAQHAGSAAHASGPCRRCPAELHRRGRGRLLRRPATVRSRIGEPGHQRCRRRPSNDGEGQRPQLTGDR
jgi:hypothetical protein